MWYAYQLDNDPSRLKATMQKTTDHRMTMPNNLNPNRIVGYTRPRDKNLKHFETKKSLP